MSNIIKTCVAVGALYCSFSGDCMEAFARSSVVLEMFDDPSGVEGKIPDRTALQEIESFCKIDLVNSVMESHDSMVIEPVFNAIFPRRSGPHHMSSMHGMPGGFCDGDLFQRDRPYVLQNIMNALLRGDEIVISYWERRGFTDWMSEPDLSTYAMIYKLRRIDGMTDCPVQIMKGDPEVAISFFDKFFPNATLDEAKYLYSKSVELSCSSRISSYWKQQLQEEYPDDADEVIRAKRSN